MSNVFSRVRVKVEEAVSPRVVQPSEAAAGGRRSWASSSGVIRTSELTRECFGPTAIFIFHEDEIRNCFPPLPPLF